MIGFGRIGHALLDLARIRSQVARTLRHVRSRRTIRYDGFMNRGLKRFVSFGWEKKLHPQIPDVEIALPHFIEWFRRYTTE
jgi:hypothetical protein